MRRTLTPEHRAKIALALHGKPKTAKTREKTGAAKRGKFLSPEHKANIAAAQRKRWTKAKITKKKNDE